MSLQIEERELATGPDESTEQALSRAERQAQAMADRMRAVAAAAAGVIGAESLDTLQTVLRDACARVVSIDTFTFALYDAAAHTLSYMAGYDGDVPVPAETISAAGVPSERVVRERRSLVTLRADDPAAAGSIMMGTGRRSESIIRTPILTESEVLGVITVQSYTRGLYTDGDVELLEAIASLAATALINLRLLAGRRAAEDALRVSEARFRTMFEQFPLSLQIFDSGGRTLEVNRAWSGLFGMTLEDVRNFNPLRGPQLREVRDLLERAFAGETLTTPPHPFDPRRIGRVGGESTESADGTGSKWLEVTVCPVKGAGSEIREVIVVHHDVTARRRAEEELRRAHDELEQRVEERTTELAETNMALEEEIAERERAEEELRQRTSELQAVFRALPDLYFRLDSGGTILDYHAGATSSLYLPPAEFIGHRMEEILPADVGRQFADGAARVAARHELVLLEYSLPVGDEEWDFEARLVPLEGDQIISVVRDITDRKEVERALQRSEEHFRALIENSSDIATIIDPDGVSRYQSPSFERVLGYTPEERTGTRPFESMHPDDVPVARETLARMMRNPGSTHKAEFRYRHRDGSWRCIEAVGRTLLADSAAAGVIINSRDVTDRKEAEEALRRSEEHFRSLIQNASDVITILDADGTVRFESAAIEPLFGYAAEELSGLNAFEYIHPEDVDCVQQTFLQVVQNPGTTRSVQLRFRHKDGSWRFIESVGRTLSAASADEGVVINSRDISDRKRAEDALRLQKTLLEAQGEASIDGILFVSAEGEMQSFNRRFIEMWGIPAEVIEQRSDEAAIQHVLAKLEDPEEFLTRVAHLYEHRDEESRDEIFLRDGRVFDRYSAPVKSRDGDYYGRIWFFRDMTDRKQAEEALRASEESYRGLFDNLTELVYIQDLEGKFVSVNQAVVQTYGYSREEIIGQGPALLADPEHVDVEDTMERFRRAVAGRPQRFEWWGRRKDGSVFPKEVVLTRSTYFGQDVVIAVARDVTDRKEAEEALQRSEEHFRRLIENAYDMVLVMDAAGTITYASPSAQRVLGSAPEELTGSSGFSLVHPDDVDTALARTTETVVTPGVVVSAELRLRHRDGSYRVLETFCRTVADDSAASGIVVNGRDVTERKQIEAEAERAREEAERANRAKSEFLSRMSHELRTPMNSILGFAQLLAKKELPPDQRKGVDHILRAGRHLLNLINEVLDIARIEANRQQLSIEPVRVSTALQEAVSLIRPLAAQHGCEVDPLPPAETGYHVRADRQRLAQVLLNLLSNAVKYNRPGGRVGVSYEPVGGREGEAGLLRISVYDTGRGIPPERMPELFVPFARLGAEQTAVEGTGLGLALSQRLVEAMGGQLRAESTPGQGSTFFIELPLADSPLERWERNGGTRAGALDAAMAGTATLLYIEDNLANLSLIETILAARPGVTLLSALQGQLGLDLAWEHHPDLILLDLHLPDVRGDEVLRRLQSDPRTRDTPVIVISADATAGRVRELLAAGAHAYLTKPLDIDHFLETIDRMLGQHGRMSHDDTGAEAGVDPDRG